MLSLIRSDNFEDIIRECFSQDKELLDKWHVAAGMGHEYCVNKTIDDMKSFDKSLKFYIIKDNERNVGFFATEFGNFLTTLFMLPEYRSRDNIKQFWNFILANIDKPFKSGIYAKNTPCKDFFLKNGGNIIDMGMHMNNMILVFEFKGDF